MSRVRYLLLAIILTSLLGCSLFRSYDIIVEPRNFIVDVKNTVFNSPTDPDPSIAGLGIGSVTITISAENSSGEPVDFTSSLAAADVDSSDNYTRVSVPIEGEFQQAVGEGGAFTVLLDQENYDITPEIDWPYFGWTTFANVEKLKLDFSLNRSEPENSSLRLLVCPRGGSSPEVLVDSGVQAGAGFTDRGAALLTKQIAFRLTPAENKTDLTFDVYTLVVAENLAVVYNPAVNFDATYEVNPWTDRWTYEEVISTGKTIGSETYVLQRLTTDGAWEVADPMGDGLESGLVDLTASTDDTLTDKYLLLAFVLHYGTLSVPLDIFCIDIE